MHTPKDEDFSTIIKEFNKALSRMGPGMGDPVTRAEKALLKTFYMFMQQRYADVGAPASSEVTQPQTNS
jgi:hypothetical protein